MSHPLTHLGLQESRGNEVGLWAGEMGKCSSLDLSQKAEKLLEEVPLCTCSGSGIPMAAMGL